MYYLGLYLKFQLHVLCSVALVILFLDNQIHSSFLIQSLLRVDLYLNEHTGSLSPE